MVDGQKYLVRDPQGNVYGPADGEMLRAWVREGRIVPGMHVAPRETREWVEVSVHPETAGEVAIRAAELGAGTLPQQDQGPIPEAGVPAATESPGSVGEGIPPRVGMGKGEVIEGVVEEAPGEVEVPEAHAVAEEPRESIAGEPEPVSPGMEDVGRQPQAMPGAVPGAMPSAMPGAAPGQGVSLVPIGPPGQELMYAQPARHNIPGMLSMIFGILSLPLSCGACGCVILWPVALLLALAGVTLGSIGIWQMNGNPVGYHGKGMAAAGVVTGGLTLLLFVGGIVTLAIMSYLGKSP
jgi:hypothetical protein